MKITNCRVIVTCPGRNYVLLKIETDEPGLYGVGDATLNGRELSVAVRVCFRRPYLFPLLIGRDPRPDRRHLAVRCFAAPIGAVARS